MSEPNSEGAKVVREIPDLGQPPTDTVGLQAWLDRVRRQDQQVYLAPFRSGRAYAIITLHETARQVADAAGGTLRSRHGCHFVRRQHVGRVAAALTGAGIETFIVRKQP